MDVRGRSYPFAVACGALDIPIETFRSWLKKEVVHFSDEEIERKPNGLAHRLTYTTVLRLAIMAELMKFGMSPKKAWTSGFYYTAAGGVWTGKRKTTRLPGELFQEGQTWLIVPAEDELPKVANFKRDDLAALLAAHASSAIVIHMNPFVETVDQKLADLAERSAA